MFKLKTLKILLLLVLFAFTGQNAFAGYDAWFHFQAEAKTNTGEGLVYGQFENQSAQDETLCENNEITSQQHKHFDNLNSHPNSMSLDFYMVAKAKPGYRFVEWEKVEGDTYTKVSSSEYATRYGIVDQRVGFANSSVTSSVKCSDESSYNHSTNDPGYTTNATFFAKFEPLTDETVVLATVNNDLWGAASANPIINAVDTVVKLFAVGPSDLNNRLGYEKKFVGWKKDNVIVSKDTVYSFRITEENKGTYTAVFEDGYKFHRIKNRATGNYLTATNDQGGLDDLSSLKLVNGLNNVIFDAGSIIEIQKGQVYNNQKTSKRTYYNYIVQGADSKQFYDFKYDDPNGKNPYTPDGVFVRMPYNASYNNWLFSTDDVGSLRLRDNNEKVDFTAVNTSNTEWYIEPMDKDLNTKENYFSLDPAKLVEVDGKYYTTLRTSWNILFNPEQMTPYIVKSVDETAGTFEMEPITGNIIPAGTPVIIETSSTDIEANRMVPTLTNAASGAVPEGNLLKVSTKYFPNQDAPVANCKGLIKNTNGQLAFGGNALSKVNGNEAYLSVATEVVLPTKAQDITLAELVRSGNTKTLYNITDLTAVDAVDHGTMLICKDNNGYASKDENTEQYIDFMHTLDSGSGLTSTVPVTYDQSNWIGLRLPGDAEFTDGSLRNKLLKGVVGRLVNTTNPEFVLDKNSLAVNEQGIAAPTSLNPFVAASFYGQNHQTSSVNSKEYFFVQPKPMEMANVEWAQWNGEKFVAPLKSSNNNWNPVNLQGEFEFNGSYLEQGGVFLETGHCYEMLPAIIKAKDGNNYPHVYVLGDVNGQGRSPQKGVEMYTSDGNIYTATVTVNNVNNGYGYFSFTKKLAGRDVWDDIKDYRFGAEAEGENYYVDPNYLGNELPLAYWSGASRSFQLAQGTYRLMVNLSTLKLVITPGQAGVPGVKDGSNGYVVYPLQINKVTTEENGVITAIDGVQSGKTITRVVYYNLMGVGSDKPHHGINIVETLYSDGSRSAVKVVK